MMLRILARIVLVLILLVSITRPASAYYDDVHYGLNYYIARVIGFTPAQAHRLASLCVMVDYAPATEPTQLDGGFAALLDGGKETLGVLAPRLGGLLGDLLLDQKGLWALISPGPNPGFEIKTLLNRTDIQEQLNELPKDVEKLLRLPKYKGIFTAQWKFHAFRDLDRFPDAKLDGPDAQAAIKAIAAQHEVLLKEATELNNPGVFLHFFQDEVPHSGYCTGGGHWILLPGVYRSIGASTDYLSVRSMDDDLAMVRATARFMLDFMRQASVNKHQPLLQDPDAIAERVRPVLFQLRNVNPAPLSLRTTSEVIFAKLLHARHEKGEVGSSRDEVKFTPHADGPNLNRALDAIKDALRQDGMQENTVPPSPLKLGLSLSGSSTGANLTTPDEGVLYGTLYVHIHDPKLAPPSGLSARPTKVTVTVWSVPTQKNEQRAKVGSAFSTIMDFTTFDGTSKFTVAYLPVGELEVEAHYIDAKGTTTQTFKKRVQLDKRVVDLDMAPGSTSGKFILENIDVDPRKISGKVDEDSQRKIVETLTATSWVTEYSGRFNNGPLERSRTEWTYQAPPTELRPGQEFTLVATGTFNSDRPGAKSASQGRYSGRGIFVEMLQAGTAGEKTHIDKFRVPPESPPKFEVIRITLVPSLTTYNYRWVAEGAGTPVVPEKPNTPVKPKIGGTEKPPSKPVVNTEVGQPLSLPEWIGKSVGNADVSDEGAGFRVKNQPGQAGNVTTWNKAQVRPDSDLTVFYQMEYWKSAPEDSWSVEFLIASSQDAAATPLFTFGRRVTRDGNSEHFLSGGEGKRTPRSGGEAVQFRVRRLKTEFVISLMESSNGGWKEYGRIKSGSLPALAFFGIRIQSKTASRNEITVGMFDIGNAP